MNPGSELQEICLEHGSGGALSRELTEQLIHPFFENENFKELSDASAFVIEGRTFLTTDTYVVDPIFFPGSDIGRLAVFGTCNDLAVCGAKPRYLTLALVIEEGFPINDLKRVLHSVSEAAREAQVRIISGDTKVVPQGKGGGLFINTAGVGAAILPPERLLTPAAIQADVCVLLSAAVGAHGLAVLCAREALPISSGIRSDCAFLYPLCESLCSLGPDLRFMRDATRGGVAAVLNEMVGGLDLSLRVEETRFPVLPDVAAVSELLGLNPLEIANEGVLIAAVSPHTADRALELLKEHPLGRMAAIIGRISKDHPGKVVLETAVGGRRILDLPRGLLLPRIC